MSTTLFQRYGGGVEGMIVLTRAANPAGDGTRLELCAWAGASGNWPATIQDPAEAEDLARQLRRWASIKREGQRRERRDAH